jgi:O-acetyl-ADP-ribose deacetylase (regulator of RNase III)
MLPISYIKGDATLPQGSGNKIITHICNDIGAWGKGFVLAISNRWIEPEIRYKNRYRFQNRLILGTVQFIKVENNIWVANMIAQHGIKRTYRDVPIRYNALLRCLKAVADRAKGLNAIVHMPRIGCGLAGGRWDKIEPLIQKELSSKDIAVTVYDF